MISNGALIVSILVVNPQTCNPQSATYLKKPVLQSAVDGDDLSRRLGQPLRDQQQNRFGLIGRLDRRCVSVRLA